MSKQVIKPSEFSWFMQRTLDKASEETVEKVNEAALDESKECVREIKAASKAAFGTGKYQRGWSKRRKKMKNGYYTYIIYNKTRYMLTHLLEFGHEIWYYSPTLKKAVDSGRHSKPKTHIRPVAEASSERYYKKIKEKLSE